MSEAIADLFKSLTHGVYLIGVADGETRNAFTAAWVMQISFDPLLLALSINPDHASFPLLESGGAFSVNVLKKDQPDLAEHYGKSGDPGPLAEPDWTTGKFGPPLRNDAMAWFECKAKYIAPAGDHMLVTGEVVGGKLLDADAMPMTYADTGNLDGAGALFPDSFTG
ncbi:Diflavin flavoprotein A 1 [Methyloligella halotolerans]|uniref:Diflavin flavoprotein A 1 n=1 Tax=Methyloligella halotolerans TaxID=1177755 RepID=A0A1E2RWW5_9HYPH|nr:flavin reductase family protein [Methyloligella halotolerans]ODA66724.1 Diflavin flavoprotein A 1 [Methyloligella halotolerans]